MTQESSPECDPTIFTRPVKWAGFAITAILLVNHLYKTWLERRKDRREEQAAKREESECPLKEKEQVLLSSQV